MSWDHLLRSGLVGLAVVFYLACASSMDEDTPQNESGDSITIHDGMVYIPPGKVKVRVYERRKENGPLLANYKIEKVANGYFIDKYEYPNVPGKLPLGDVSFIEAQSKCIELGKRLCTMHEWLKACQGPKMTFYHYGNRHRVKQRDLGEYPAPPQESGTRRFCESGYGVCDMCGNLWEWTTQPAIEQYCRYSDPAKRLLLGGCGGFDGYAPSCNDMTGNEMTYSCETFGFRCCRDAD